MTATQITNYLVNEYGKCKHDAHAMAEAINQTREDMDYDNEWDLFHLLVETAIEEVRINENDLEYSMEIDYDNKIELTDISLQNSDTFSEKIMCAIDSHYKIEETEDNK